MVTKKSSDVPPQDTYDVFDLDTIVILNGQTYETEVFTTDGWGKICGSIVHIPVAGAAYDLDFRIYQGDNDADAVGNMDTYSTRDAADRYHPETNGAGVAQDGCYTNNGWEISVIGKTALIQIRNITGVDITVNRLNTYLRKQ